jgi:tetratricopeptide (TPR) repeat protein
MPRKTFVVAAALSWIVVLGFPSAAFAQAAASPAQTIFFDAFELLRQGDLDKAEARFREGLALDPENARARLLLGDTLRAKKDLAGARAAYEEAQRKGAPDVAGEARQRLTQLPSPAVARSPAGAGKDPDKARESLIKAVALVKQPTTMPEAIPICVSLAEALTELGDRTQALGVLKIAIDNTMRGKSDFASFGGSGARDASETLARAARDQWKAGDADAAGRTLQMAEGVARSVSAENEKSKAAALTSVAMGYAAVGDTSNANRVYNDALGVANRADEGLQSDVRAEIAVARFRAGDVKGALSMEALVKQRHPRFYVGHSWPHVMTAMATAEARAGRYDKVVQLMSAGGDETGVATSSAYLELVTDAIERERFQSAEDLVPRITSDEKRFDAVNAIALAYAARNRKADVQRMLTRLREFGEGSPAHDALKVERDHIHEALPAVLVYMGLRDEAQKRAAAAKSKSDALAALAHGFALTGDLDTAFKLVADIPKEQDYRRNDALRAMAQDCAIADLACAMKVIQSPQFPDYTYAEVLKSRAKAGDWQSPLKLGASLERIKPLAPSEDANDSAVYYSMREAAHEVAKLGLCDEALRYAKYAEKDFVFWTLVGRCQAGLPVVTLEDSQ